MPKSPWRRTVLFIVATLIAGIALFYALKRFPSAFQKDYGDPIKAALVVVIGGAISYLLERTLKELPDHRLGSRRVTTLRFLTRLVLYLAIALGVLASLGVGLSSVVFGSAFLTVIIGLAGQSLFGNLIAGIGLVLFHPFEVGERISFVAWQYPILMPSFPHEALKPGYAGTVTDINLMYTSLITDDGIPLVVPNGIIIQSAIHNVSRRANAPYRFRFDVALTVDPERFLEDAGKALQSLSFPVHLAVYDTTPTSYSVVATGELTQMTEDAARHHIMSRVLPIIRALSSPNGP